MSRGKRTIFSRIIALVFILVTVLGALFMGITHLTATAYNEASTQLLNKDVAEHIAKFSSPFEGGRFDRKAADSVFHDAMVLNPSSEVYFLDNDGAVIGYEADDTAAIRQQRIPLKKIHAYLAAGKADYIKGPDPRDPDNPKIFSAAEVRSGGRKLGYIYVILGSKGSRDTAQMLLASHAGKLTLAGVIAVILLSLLISVYYISRIQRRFNHMLTVLDRFQHGDLDARFRITAGDDLAPVTAAFNKMADELVVQINRVTKSEAERKTFIAGISHDLRTPVSIARGYAETLLIKGANAQPSEGEEYAGLVLKKIQQVESLVSQLHELSLAELVSEPKREPFVFSELLMEGVHTFRTQAAERGITIDCTHCEDTSWINADIRLMERVIQNLLLNTVAHSTPNTAVDIALEQADNALLFRIANTGEPLPPDLVRWLASDEDDDPNPRPAKPSIGLMIVKRILHLHGYPFRVRVVGEAISFEVRMEVWEVGGQSLAGG